MTGAGLTALVVSRIGTENLLLCSAGILLLCAGLVALIVRREAAAGRGGAVAAEEEGVGGKEALRLLRESRHLQIIALVIAFAAVGAGLIEQQLNMAAEAFKGRSATDNLTEFLAQVTLYLSAIGFFIQVALTSRIHRYLGRGLRPPRAPDEPRRDRRRHAPERGPLGPGAGAHPRHVAALHARQDHAGGPVPPPADRPQVPGQALRGRDGRPLRQGAGRAPGPRPHQALGPGASTGSRSATRAWR